ncbi:MAG TPA: M28 family peptidase, partial [Candidatus Kapabacteria bacterium]|nr:M28 family peptidase [Candidatus Kapabacteria bacterium]
GTSSVMTIAEAFSKAAASGMRPRRSVIFLSVTGEEKGLFGSKYYVGHPLFPLAQTVADVNTDMTGRIDSAHEQDQNYVYVIGDGRLSTQLHEINERNNADFTHLTLDYRFDSLNDPNRFYYRSDHYEFAQKGIPITFYFDGIHADYHRPSDTFDKIDFAIMETRARLAFLTAWEIANREERLKVDKPAE